MKRWFCCSRLEFTWISNPRGVVTPSGRFAAPASPPVPVGLFAIHAKLSSNNSDFLGERFRCDSEAQHPVRSSEVRHDRIDDVIFIVDDGNESPFVERGAWMGNS